MVVLDEKRQGGKHENFHGHVFAFRDRDHRRLLRYGKYGNESGDGLASFEGDTPFEEGENVSEGDELIEEGEDVPDDDIILVTDDPISNGETTSTLWEAGPPPSPRHSATASAAASSPTSR